jgi:lysine/ornithine N-monooxygenase
MTSDKKIFLIISSGQATAKIWIHVVKKSRNLEKLLKKISLSI